MLGTRTIQKKTPFWTPKFDPFKRSKLHRPPFKFSVAENLVSKPWCCRGHYLTQNPNNALWISEITHQKMPYVYLASSPHPLKKKVNLISLMTSWMFGLGLFPPPLFSRFSLSLANQQQKTPKPISPPSLVHDCRCSVEILSVSKPPKTKEKLLRKSTRFTMKLILPKHIDLVLPIGSMYGIFTYMNGWCLWEM